MKTTKKEFLINKTDKYTGVIYNDHKEYFKVLAEKFDKSVAEVADLVIASYQSLQMTRVAQGLYNAGKFTPGMTVEVLNLPGTRSSSGGPTKGQVAKATKLVEVQLGTQKVSGLTPEVYAEKVAIVANAIKASDDKAKEAARKAEAKVAANMADLIGLPADAPTEE